jgi:hypothetical protein
MGGKRVRLLYILVKWQSNRGHCRRFRGGLLASVGVASSITADWLHAFGAFRPG